MGQDLPRRPSQQGFHNTFGQGRSVKRDSIQGDSQRAAGDTAPNPKRPRTVDRSDERSPVGQRDRLEGSNPTSASHRQRHPDNPRPHPSSQLSKASTSHLSGVSLKPVLDLVSERMAWFRARNEAQKSHKRAMANQEQSHYRPSDFASSPELLATHQRQTLEDMRKAEKNLGEFDDRIASVMQPLLQHISEAWDKSPDASKASVERAVSEAKMNTIQNTIKKEMEESLKKEVTESQQSIKELVGSQMAKLKETLAQENEQKLHSLQKTLAQEAEDRATSLRKTLIQENEKRVAEMKDSITREHKARITALENALSEEAKNKERIAELERVLSEETKNKDKIAELERVLSEETKNKDKIAELEKIVSEGAKHKARIAELEKIQPEQKEKNATFSKRIAWLGAGLERAAADQKLLVESLIDKTQLTVLDEKMARLDTKLRKALSEQRSLSESFIDKTQLDQQLQQLSLSQDEKFSKLEARVSLLPDHSPRIKELAGQVGDHSKIIKEKEQQQDEVSARLHLLESSLSNFLAEGEEIKECVRKLSSNKSTSVSDNKILEVIRPELTKNVKDTREMIMQIQTKLKPFLEQERHKRETLEEQIGDFTRQISEIQKESATIKTDYSGSMEKINDQSQSIMDEVKQLSDKTNYRLGLMVDDFRSSMAGIYMQVQTLNQWQTNFDTTGLYRNIIAHINRTIPEPQIKLLKQQVSGIETRIAAWENTSNKKRKLLSGNAKAVSGHQTDA